LSQPSHSSSSRGGLNGYDVTAIVGEDGRLLAIRKRNLPREADAVTPKVPGGAAAEMAGAHARRAFREAKLRQSEPVLEILVGPDQKGYLAWSLEVRSTSLTQPQARRYWISAATEPRVLYFESLIYHQFHQGTVTGTLWDTTPVRGTISRRLASLEVTRTGSSGGSRVTGADGYFRFSGTGSVTIRGALRGPSCEIGNVAGPVMDVANMGDDLGPIDLDFRAAAEFELAQTTAFHWTNRGFQFVGGVVPRRRLPVVVNINATCNAYWDGQAIHFYRAGGGCPNTAYSDVIIHEMGHGIDQWLGDIRDGGYSEGFGDSLAILITGQPCTGRDFWGRGTCLRSALDVHMWPPDPHEGPHDRGRRYGQFTWQVVERLGTGWATRLILGAAALNPADIPDAVELSFVADDNDNDLSNGTPHCKQLAEAADARGIPHPPCPPSGCLDDCADNFRACMDMVGQPGGATKAWCVAQFMRCQRACQP
ncbi:MAG: hypothetical protein AAB403_11730, partial [Planctomycetota bacterium]